METDSRSFVYREEYVKINNLKCGLCKNPVFATFYDADWSARELCADHYKQRYELYKNKSE